MTKSSSRGEFNTFVGGLVTEASVLNFPEQAARDIENFVLNNDGTINRRAGFGFEPDYQYIDSLIDGISVTNGLLSTYVWEDPAGQSGEKYLVIQSNDNLFFYDLNKESVSSEGFLGSIPFTATNRYLNKASYASIDGKLVIATGDQVVYLVEYFTTAPKFRLSSFSLRTRDIWGVSVAQTDDDPNFRPTSGNSHIYNLYNQGWAVPRRVNVSSLDFPVRDAARDIRSQFGYYPADSDNIWQCYITVSRGSSPLEVYDRDTFRSLLNSNSVVSKGYFIIDLLGRGDSREASVVANKAQFPEAYMGSFSAPLDKTFRGATVVCEYAGRVFYAGFGPTTDGDARSPDLSSYVAFSRLIRNKSDFSKCYQEGDPTSRDSSDIVDTDGGLIRISGAANIRRLIVQGTTLLVIADNGVWSVDGGSDYGFSASNYKVNKISTFGSLNSDSVVTDGARTYYWAEDSIYVIFRNELDQLIYESLSDQRIASFYGDIATSQKVTAKGVYDKVAKKLRWIYQEDSWFDANSSTKELVFDTQLGAFYKNTVKNVLGTAIVDAFVSSPFITEIVDGDVFVGTDRVFAGIDLVDITDVQVSDNLQTVKYIGGVNQLDTIKLAIGWYRNLEYSDWKNVDNVGSDAKAYLMTGAITAGDSSIHKQTPVLVVHMKRTEDTINSNAELTRPSGCLVRTMWDFATSPVSNKFSPLFQVYRYRRPFFAVAPGSYNNGFEIITTRNKLRGRGRAFSVYMETEPEKDCQIIGWNLSLNGNSVA